MADVEWPDKLPKPSTKRYEIRPRSSVKRTEFSAGYARHRRVYRDLPDIFVVTWEFDSVEFGLFEGFFTHDLDDGMKWFDMDHYIGAGTTEGEFRFANPLEPYTAINNGQYDFTVTATLERLERKVLDQASYEVLRDGDEANETFVEVSSRLHQYLHETMVANF